jgi:monoamine oxidase
VRQVTSVEKGSIIIVGAGASGLAASSVLCKAGFHPTILEARHRPGGRIHTEPDQHGHLRVEVGAEFIHGRKNRTWKIIREAKLQTHEVPDRHWIAEQGMLRAEKEFWDELNSVTQELSASEPDMDFASYLASVSASDSAKWLMREYVEGFHAAPVGQMSTSALALAEKAAEKAEATRQFRLDEGYASLIQFFLCKSKSAQIVYQTQVKSIRWEPGCVEIEAQGPHGLFRCSSSKVLVTVPLGVLKKKLINFNPPLNEKQKAIDGLGMGEVIKLTLQFQRRFWPVANFGFIHSADKWLPTWWVDERSLLLTGWAGGSRAQVLSRENNATVLEEAIRALSMIFRISCLAIRDLLTASYFHDWSNDPFTRGAYSFTPTGMNQLPELLGEAVAGTIFFAGEATDGKGAQGTVHGAIESGERAAREILKKQRKLLRVAI